MIGRGIGAETVEEDLRGPEVVVDARVEKGAGIAGPTMVPSLSRRCPRLRRRWPDRASGSVQFIAALVAAPGEQAMVRRMDGVAEAEKNPSLRQCVAVEENVLVAARCGLAADRLMLPFRPVAPVIEPMAVARRERMAIRSRRRAPPFPRRFVRSAARCRPGRIRHRRSRASSSARMSWGKAIGSWIAWRRSPRESRRNRLPELDAMGRET